MRVLTPGPTAMVGAGLRRGNLQFEAGMSSVERWARRHYPAVAGGLVALALLNEWLAFGRRLADWDVLYVASVLTLVAGWWCGLLVPLQIGSVVRRLADRQVLTGDPVTLVEAIAGRQERWARRGGAVVGLALLAAFLFAFRSAAARQWPFTAMATAGGYVSGRMAGRMIANGTLGQVIDGHPGDHQASDHQASDHQASDHQASDHQASGSDGRWTVEPNPWHPDGAAGLEPVGHLYFRQASVLMIPAAFLGGWWFLIPLVDRFHQYDRWRTPYLALLCLTIGLEIGAFLAPMWWFHRRLSRWRAEEVAEADRRIVPHLSAIEGQIAFAPSAEERTGLRQQANELRARYEAIASMPTWPVDAGIRRRFAVNNVVLLLPVAGHLIGLSARWAGVLQEVGKVVTSLDH